MPEPTITMIAPDGSPADVPMSAVSEALKQGAQRAINMRAPDGSERWVPMNSLGHALMAGAVPSSAGDVAAASVSRPVPSGLQGPPSPADTLRFGSPLRYGSIVNEPGARAAENEVIGGGAKSLAQTVTLGHSPLGVPQTPSEKLGAAGEQGLELMAGGAALRSIPAVARIGGLGGAALRTGLEAVNMGGNAALHGQDVPTAAAIGATGGVVGELMKPLARGLAASAVGTRAMERAFGRAPEATILSDTAGFSPQKIAQTAREASLELTSQMESAAAQASGTASVRPALNVIDDAIGKLPRQNVGLANELKQTRQMLTTWADTGEAIPETVDAKTLLDLKRGIGNEISNWNPAVRSDKVQGVLKQVYHALDSEFYSAVPGVADINQRVSTLIGIADDATRKGLNAGIVQNVAHRVAAHTGALAPAILGGSVAGVPGAIAGAVAPEVISAPAVKMFGARAANLADPNAVRGAGALVNALMNRQRRGQ